MKSIRLRHHDLTLLSDSARVIIRPFIPADLECVGAIIDRVLALSEDEVVYRLDAIREDFSHRHLAVEAMLDENYDKVRSHVAAQEPLSRERQLLIGAMFSGEYAIESAALFNPSIVPHPDQAGVAAGGLRFILSLRATGEGHISSIEFRTGNIAPDGSITIDPASRFVTTPQLVPDPIHRNGHFIEKLYQMDIDDEHVKAVMAPLGETFTRSELNRSVGTVRHESRFVPHELKRTLECIEWLVDSNYEVVFPDHVAMCERTLFPVSPNETHGIEDARFVRFTDDDGSVVYYATYTAYSGHDILPQLIETVDFSHFRISTLSGCAVRNKGMAMFPRRVGGMYAMLSRQDDENLFIMFSDNPHHWSDPQVILRPSEVWESVKIGNCGSPVETDAGWLVITHGVGPMRRYCIGAALLDLDDPTKVIGRLREPLLSTDDDQRDGYVPNVVYSCGALVHGGQLILPYAICDSSSAIVSIPLDDLVAALKTGSPPLGKSSRPWSVR